MTPEEADENLAQAIRIHADAYKMFRAGDLLADYALIANWQSTEGGSDSGYSVHYSRPEIPHHIAVGLFSVAISLVAEGPEEE